MLLDRYRCGSHSDSDPGSGDRDRAHSSADRDDCDQPLEYHTEESDFSNAAEQHSPHSRGCRHIDHASRQDRHLLDGSRRSCHRHQRPSYSHHRHAAPLHRTSALTSLTPGETGYHSRSDRENHHSRWPDTSSSSPSSSLSSSSTSTSSDSSRDCHHRHRRQHSSHYHSHMSAAAVVSCSFPLPHHVQRKIKTDEYVNFDRLLPSADSPPFAHTRHHRHHKATSLRTATDLATSVSLSHMIPGAKYQTIVCMLFTHYPPQAGVAYDQHFRQQAAIRPGLPEEDIFMWALHTSRTVTHPTPANMESSVH